MSGQQSRLFDPTPGQPGTAGNIAAGPSVRAATYQGTQAHYVNDGRGMAAIGNAISDFFNVGAKAAETVAQIQHREEVIQIQRENEALRKQGMADQMLGKPMAPEHMERRDYFEAYQTSAADAQANTLSEGLREHLAQQPLDGSVDFAKEAETYYKVQVGNGTGDPVFDSRALAQFTRHAEAQVASFNEARRATALQNTAETIRQEVARRILSPDGVTAPQLSEVADRLLSVTHGNTANRDAMLMSIVSGAVQNDGQGVGVLKALQDLGYDQSQPEFFNRVSGEILKRTNQVKTHDAGVSLDNWRFALAEAKRKHPNGILPREELAEFITRAEDIDRIHGVGQSSFGLEQEIARSVEKAADVNTFLAAFSGELGTHSGADVALARGKPLSSVLNDGHDLALSNLVTAAAKVAPYLQPLVKSKNGVGLLEPMESDEAALGFADFITAGGESRGYRAAAMDSMSERNKNIMGAPLLGRDADAMTRAYGFYNRLRERGLTQDQLHRYFPSDAAENAFNALSGMQGGSMSIRQAAQYLADNPYDAKKFAEAFKSGRADLTAAARVFGVDVPQAAMDAKVFKARRDAVLSSAGRKKFFGGWSVSFDSNELAAQETLLMQQFMMQGRAMGTIDVDKAVESVAGQTGKYIMVPGMGDNLQAVRDPFKGRGRHLMQPLNEAADHPLFGQAPVFALGAKIVNAVGKEEDTLETWAEDAQEAHKAFPGKIDSGDHLWLNRPNGAGLSMVRKVDGSPIVFSPGEELARRTGSTAWYSRTEGYTKVAVPMDPDAAGQFFRDHLGPGWFAVRENGLYVLHYGARVKVGKNEAEAIIKRGGELYESAKTHPVGQPQDTMGGAAILFRNPRGTSNGTP